MTLHRSLPLLMLLCFFAWARPCHAQKETSQTQDAIKEGLRAKTDSLYFEAIKARMKKDEPLALRLFEKYVTLRPDVSAAFYELAKLNYNDKKLEKAREYIKKATDLAPGNKWYKEQYAIILAEIGEFEQAGKIMGDLSQAETQDPSYPMMAAEYYEKAKNYNQALNYLDKAIVKRGTDEDLLLMKEQVYLNMNNIDKAAEMVKLLTEHEPKNGKYYKLLGDLYDNNKLPGKAAEVYQKAEKIIPGDPYIQAGRAEHFLRVGDTASYLTYMAKAIVNKELDAEVQVELLGDYIQSLPNDSVVRIQGLPIASQLVSQHPADPQILLFYGTFLEMNNQADSAARVYQHSLKIKSSIDVWKRLLDNFLRRQLADSVVKNSEKFIRSYPNQVEPQVYNARGHLLKKAYDKAIKAINHAIDNQPENDKTAQANLYATMGDIYHEAKQEDFSDKAYDKALSLDPGNATALNNYAYYLSERSKKLDEAEKMSKRSLDLQPGNPTFLDTYGWILYKKGDYEKAKTFIKRAVDLMGNSADGAIYDHLGNIYYKLNDKDKALESWKQAKQKGVDDVLIDKKISEGKLYE
jgi:tetratricopeptide (TPR) repeat protein